MYKKNKQYAQSTSVSNDKQAGVRDDNNSSKIRTNSTGDINGE